MRHSETLHLFARQLEAGEVYITAVSRLGGVPIQSSLSMPLELETDEHADFDVFDFVLTAKRDAERFFAGQIIELEP